MYGRTPMREALKSALTAFLGHPKAKQRALVLVSDGESTDGDPVPRSRELQQEAGVVIASVYLTVDKEAPHRRLYYQPEGEWGVGQHKLFSMAARVACASHPIPVLATMGWDIPWHGECALYVTACSSELLGESCSLLLSAGFGSIDNILNVVSSVQHDAYVNDEHLRTCNNPSRQGHNDYTCYAHAIAAVIRMALDRIIGRAEGYPTIEEIRERILREFPPVHGRGANAEKVLTSVIEWYRPLRSCKVDEIGARNAVVRRRSLLTCFQLSKTGWDKFTDFFFSEETGKSTLTQHHMAQHRSGPRKGGHAVVLVECEPNALIFLNSWGPGFGSNGSFKVRDPTVLQCESSMLEGPTPVHFYDIYWLEKDLAPAEQQAFTAEVERRLNEHVEDYPDIRELEARCPRCSANSPIAQFRGTIRSAECPRCHRSFVPEPGHLVQALYARVGVGQATKPQEEVQEE